jgi:hypothetical protein
MVVTEAYRVTSCNIKMTMASNNIRPAFNSLYILYLVKLLPKCTHGKSQNTNNFSKYNSYIPQLLYSDSYCDKEEDPGESTDIEFSTAD